MLSGVILVAVVERNGHFYAVISIGGGKQKWISCGTSKSRARALHDEYVVKARRGELVVPKPMKFGDFAELWLRDYCEPTLRPNTVSEYRSTLKNYLIPEFGHLKMAALRPDEVQRFVSQQVAAKKLSAKTIRNMLVPLKRMYAIAIRWGYASQNPAEHIALPRIERKEMAFLTAGQMRQLIEATDEEWKALIACACMLGTRKMETLGLTHDCLLFTEHAVQIKQALYKGTIVEPKTPHSVARLPMPPTLEALLMERVMTAPPNPMNLVFCHKDGRPLRPEFANRGILAPALKRAGLPRVDFHSLRHGYISALLTAGVSLPVLQELARHASIQTTIDRYGHLAPDATNDAAKRLETAVWGG